MDHNTVLFVVLVVVCGLCSMGVSEIVTSKTPFTSHITGGYKHFQMNTNDSKSYCRQFRNDYDILRQMPFSIVINPMTTEDYEKSTAKMDDNDTFVTKIVIENENQVPFSVFCFSSLQQLLIRATPFVNDIVPDALGNLKTLRQLSISETRITKMTEQLAILENLATIRFINCSLTYLPNLSKLHKLQLLILVVNHLSELNGIPAIKLLDLQRNLFKQIPILENSENLEFLAVSGNPLENVLPITSYENLESLFLAHTPITSIPATIDKLQNLEYLYLAYNKLSDLPLSILNLPRLEYFNASRNSLSPDDIQLFRQAFQKTHPNIELDL